jgi:hypothetical protein
VSAPFDLEPRAGTPGELRLLIAAALIALAPLSACAATSTVTGTPRADGTSTAGYVRDGSLAFEVTGVEQRDIAGDPATPGYFVTAKGVYVVVSLQIRNVGNRPVTLVDSDQTLVDATGRSFATDRAANIYDNREVPSTRIVPGGQLRVRLAFDVPVGTQPREIVLRESASSAGVVIALG